MANENKKYLAWLHGLPCAACGVPAEDAHHLRWKGLGIGVRCSDYHAIPLCRKCHSDIHDVGVLIDGARALDLTDLLLRSYPDTEKAIRRLQVWRRK